MTAPPLRPPAGPLTGRRDGRSERLAWDVPVLLHAELHHAEPPHAEPPHAEPPHAEPPHAEPPHAEPLRAAGDDQVLRLHADPRCAQRLAPARPLAPRPVADATADELCSACADEAVARSTSSAVLRLADALAVLESLRERAVRGAASPRDALLARAIRFEAEQRGSLHPAAAPLVADVVGLATEVVEHVRRAVLSAPPRG